MSTIESYPRLMDALQDVRRRWRTRQVLDGALRAAAGVLAVLAVLVLADNLLHPGTLGRVLLAAVLWGGLACAVFSLVVRRLLEDRRDDYFAALVEEKYPALHNRLINALQLGRGSQRGFSPDLIGAIVRDADRATADLEPAESVDRRPARRAALYALAALLLVAGYAAAFGPHFRNGLARVLLPGSDIPPYTRTQIDPKSVLPGDTRVPEGSARPLAFEVRVRGEVPAAARLHRRPAGGAEQVGVMQPDPGRPDTFRFVLQQAAESFDYFITAGDARSDDYRVEVVKRPQVARLGLAYTPPAYTGLPVKRVAESDGGVAALPGTRVELELTATKPLREAVLETKAGMRLELERRGDDRAWGAGFVVTTRDARLPADLAGTLVEAPAAYQTKLLDTDGTDNNDPLWRQVTPLRDQPPAVTLGAPADRLGVKPGAVVPLVVEARDDYGLGAVRLLCRVGGEGEVRELAAFAHEGPPKLQTRDAFAWDLGKLGLRAGAHVEYWAEAVDRNTVTGPGRGESRRFVVDVVDARDATRRLDLKVDDYVKALEDLLRAQRDTRKRTADAGAFADLAARQAAIRGGTHKLARAMEADGLPLATAVQALDALHAGAMADALRLLESGRDTARPEAAEPFRAKSLPVQDRIIAELAALLARLQRNEQAKEALKRMEKKDPAAHKALTGLLSQVIKDLDANLKEQKELADKFERLPKLKADEAREERLKALKDLDDLKKRAEKWAKGTVQELTKMPQGFVEDFGLRKDVNKVFEEIEKAAERPKSVELPVALEDLGAGLGTKMKEDLEMWMPDAPDNVKWLLEEPLNKKPMKIPEMPLPKALEDLIGDLLQKADEFDEDADDVTSAWGDNLDQAGWGVSDGPISSFSAKGKTGNDQPNSNEVSGRSGDGRRGKSSGQMVGDTARALPGRKTPARVGNEKYEPGQLKQEGAEDPNGATGGGKKAGAGRRGLQGGSPPDVTKDLGRLTAKQAGLREKAEQVAQKLDTVGASTRRLNESIELMKQVEKDLADRRYDDAARKRRDALKKLRTSLGELDASTAARLKRALDLPPELRNELLQSADEGYPAGYEGLLKSYYKALSTAEKEK